jgi:multisubunit Na+/H+ antiporter MnhB subunit
MAATVAAHAALALPFLVLYGIIEWRLRSLGAFTVNDALFDADPQTRMRAIAHGWERLLLIHPLFPYVFTLPIRVLAKVWALVTAAQGESDVRELLAMAVAPACGAAAVVVMARAMIATGVGRAGAVICAIGFGLSFSTLVFASIPDHFILSNLLAACGLLLCARLASKTAVDAPSILWWPLGIAATGVTISNLAIPACCYIATDYRPERGLWKTLRATATYAAVVVIVTTALALAGAASFGQFGRLVPQELGGQGSESMLLRYITPNPLARAARAPKAVADSLAPARVITVPSGSSGAEAKLPHLSLETGVAWLGAPLVVLVLLAAAVAGHRQADHGFSAPVVAALAILGGNVAFHAVFGKEYFLYSQHWMAALWLLLSGLWRSRSWRDPFVSVAGSLAIGFMAYANYGVLLQVFDALSAGRR